MSRYVDKGTACGAIGVVIPAHNEEELIADCLRAVDAAAHEPSLADVAVHVVVVCDACTDRTVEIVESLGHVALISTARNVGLARSLGAEAVLARGADWLAFTDADTVVCRRWLTAQIGLRSDVVCGTIGVDDWDVYGDAMRLHFEQTYRDEDGHRHIHGANLGISARAYRSVGGFANLENSEDVAIVDALERAGAHIAWSAAPRVVTSARACYRATAGFGATLASVAAAAARIAIPADVGDTRAM
ncbi:MAG: glycosyltransferase [Burkholderiaceae bacterium]